MPARPDAYRAINYRKVGGSIPSLPTTPALVWGN
jgi:hypothetical protein